MFQGLQSLTQNAIDFSAGRLSFGVQNATSTMRILRPKHEFCAVALTPGNQFINPLLALLQQQFDCRHIAQAVARVERVLQVQTDIVFIAQPRGLALGIDCGEIRDFLLVEKKNAPRGSQFNGRAQSGDTGAYDNKIGLGWKTFHKPGK